MEVEGYGYEVVTIDGDVIGHVVGKAGENLVVEHGRLHRVHHALPLAFATVDEAERRVQTTLSRQMIEESPKLKHGKNPTDQQVAAYYGLASGYDRPDTKGDGVVNADDPALGAEQQGLRSGVESTDHERVLIRRRMEEGTGKLDAPPRPIAFHPDANHPPS